MGFDIILSGVWIVQAVIAGVGAAALAFSGRRRSSIGMIGGAGLAFLPLLVIHGPNALLVELALMYLAGVGILGYLYAKRQMFLLGFFGLAFAAMVATPYELAKNIAPLKLAIFLREIALIASPLICAVAAAMLGSVLHRNRLTEV